MPKWKELTSFLLNDGFIKLRDGRDTWYEKIWNGRKIRVRVSKSSGDIGKAQFQDILKNQIMASKEYFSKVSKNKKYQTDDEKIRKSLDR